MGNPVPVGTVPFVQVMGVGLNNPSVNWPTRGIEKLGVRRIEPCVKI